ncbi:hypothetical protein ACX80E_11490 [Arthrobacter sp. TMN-49]
MVLLQLMASGHALVDRTFPHFLLRDQELLSGLTSGERAILAALLPKVALILEAPR